MQNNSSSDDLKKSTTLGWKFVAIVGVITVIFFTFLYLAMSSKPDYMQKHPSKVNLQSESSKHTSHDHTASSASNGSE